MELDPKDYDLVKMLTKLKDTNEAYPTDLFTSRRQNYIRRVAEIGVGLGVAAGLRSTVKSGKAGGFSSTAGSLLETALVVAIVAEAGTAAYFYRDKISEFIQSYSSNPQILEVTSPPEVSSPLPELVISQVPEITETPIAIETLTGTVTVVIPTTVAGDTNDNGNNQANSTPDPNGNNGNHFGQTPKPEQTRDPGNGSGNNNNNNNGNGR